MPARPGLWEPRWSNPRGHPVHFSLHSRYCQKPVHCHVLGQKRLILPCFTSFYAFRPGNRTVGQKENDQATLRKSLYFKGLRKDTWPKLPMEDNGLEPMTFWLPARERLGVNLYALWTYVLHEKQVHCPVHYVNFRDVEIGEFPSQIWPL